MDPSQGRNIALIRQTKGPTTSMMARKSSDFVTSTLTDRFDFFRSIVSSSSFAAGFFCWSALNPYDCLCASYIQLERKRWCGRLRRNFDLDH